MKLYTREDFLKLPPGTIYQSDDNESLLIKTQLLYNDGDLPDKIENLVPIDWYYGKIEPEDYDRRYEDAEKSISYDSVFSQQKDGFYSHDSVYLVYEKSDIKYLLELFGKCLDVSNGGSHSFGNKVDYWNYDEPNS